MATEKTGSGKGYGGIEQRRIDMAKAQNTTADAGAKGQPRRHSRQHSHAARQSQESALVRFSVAMPEDLLIALDAYVAKRGVTNNRSEAIRDLVRNALIEEDIDNPEQEVMGTLTMVYSHHTSNLKDTLDSIQHDHYREIISTMHVHLDAHNCLEVIIMRGNASTIHAIADALLGTKGVQHGKLMVTMVGDHE